MLPEKLCLVSKEIDVNGSSILFDEQVTSQNLESLFELHNSEWHIEKGWLTGRNTDESGGMAFLKQDFPGNIMLEFEGRSVLPSTHDVNFMWHTEWSDELNSCGNGYIGSICGWWTAKAGIEKSPGYKLRATTSTFNFKPGRKYKILAGSINETSFLFIDGKLIIELDDPDPVDNQKFTKVALSTFSSCAQFRNIIIRKISWRALEMKYNKEL